MVRISAGPEDQVEVESVEGSHQKEEEVESTAGLAAM
jgi:hypothetical protein